MLLRNSIFAEKRRDLLGKQMSSKLRDTLDAISPIFISTRYYVLTVSCTAVLGSASYIDGRGLTRVSSLWDYLRTMYQDPEAVSPSGETRSFHACGQT